MQSLGKGVRWSGVVAGAVRDYMKDSVVYLCEIRKSWKTVCLCCLYVRMLLTLVMNVLKLIYVCVNGIYVCACLER